MHQNHLALKSTESTLGGNNSRFGSLGHYAMAGADQPDRKMPQPNKE